MSTAPSAYVACMMMGADQRRHPRGRHCCAQERCGGHWAGAVGAHVLWLGRAHPRRAQDDHGWLYRGNAQEH
eukprot:3834289-Pyramimonas_sp.AAC.1